jgi:hypothetical protein
MVTYATSKSIDTTNTSAQFAFVNGFPTALENTPDYRLTAASTASTGASFTSTIFVGGFVGIKNTTNFSDKTVSLYPNPVSDKALLVIDALNTSLINVDIYDITGKLISSPVVNQNLLTGENTYSINTSTLNNGVYFVTISSTNGKETVKLVVSK